MQTRNIGIVGFGRYVPERRMTNFDFEKIVDTSDEWIKTRTGIEERRYAAVGENTSDLCVKAANKALEAAGLSIADIDLIVVATCTGDYPVQSTACLVQYKLGASEIPAFDISAGCSGFVYALDVCKSMMLGGNHRKILVIGAEEISRIIDMQDRSTAILFGDGACAAILSDVEEGYGIMSSYLGAMGEDNEYLRIPVGGTACPVTPENIGDRRHFVKMNGTEVFKFAVRVFPKALGEAMTKANVSADDIRWVFPHQANIRIIESSIKRLNIPSDKVVINIQKYGNTSAASVGLAIGDKLEAGELKKGDIIALVAFGAGLTYGATVMKWCY